MSENTDQLPDDEFIKKYTNPDGVTPEATASPSSHLGNAQLAAEQFFKKPAPSRGVSEAGTFREDAKANLVDGGRVVVDAVGVAATVASAGAASAAAPIASGTAGVTGGAASSVAGKAAAETAGKTAAEAAARATAEATKAATEKATKVAIESTKDLGVEATKAAVDKVTDEVAREAAANGGKKSITDLAGKSTTDTPGGAKGKSRIQEALDNLNNKSVKDKALTAAEVNDTAKTFKPSQGNRTRAIQKSSQPRSEDHRGIGERALDAQQSVTGVDALHAAGKIPLIGGILEGGSNIAIRTERQIVKRGKGLVSTGAGIMAFAVLIGGMMISMVAGAAAGSGTITAGSSACATGMIGASIDVNTVPEGPIAGYGKSQLINAAHIMNAAQKMNLPTQGQIIGVMTAMGESSLNNITYGDDINGVTNPDGTLTSSIGLFQQQKWWGTVAERMDPEISATLFFARLVKVSGWETMTPSAAAHKVQINLDPNHYTKWAPQAAEVVAGLSGVATGETGSCGIAISGEWVRPVDGPMTSPYGPRGLICNGAGCSANFHAGIDFGNACGTPIRSISNGVVTFAANAGGFGNRVIVDHGNGISSYYGHMAPNSFKVKVGDTVEIGQPVGDVGRTGVVTGCHLDLKIYVNGNHIDPKPFLEERGIIV